MRILVVGGTAGVGLAIARYAALRRHEVTVIARDPGKGGNLAIGTRFVVGDVLDPDDVARAVAGQDAVVLAVGAPRGRAPADTLSRGTRVVTAAMSRQGVGRLIVIGCARRPIRPGPLAPLRERLAGAPSAHAIVEDRERQEALVASCGLAWTLVRVAGEPVRAWPKGRRANPRGAWRDAVASFVVGEIESPAHLAVALACPAASG